MKNRLECQVTSCQHYEDGLCSLPGIKVDGPAARVCRQTCCSSYQERGKGAGTASIFSSGNASPDSSISCQAKNCSYNHDCKCEAGCVRVGCCCNDVNSKSGTECCTFRQG